MFRRRRRRPVTTDLPSGEPNDPPAANPQTEGEGDWPVETLAGDRMGRAEFARSVADEILAAPVEGGFVMGLTGPWGVGKTSILNMAMDALDDRALVVQFNPWMFSGTEALIGPFFREVASQLGEKKPALKALGEKLATYGRVLSPIAGLVGASGAVDTAAGLLGQWSAGPSVIEQRAELRTQLAGLEQRLVVVIDDVDRLRPDEVADIVRLVRLVGDFPNTLYLLAFDRYRVEECLGDGDLQRGRAYLEKIVQVTHDVPEAPPADLTALFVESLDRALDKLPTGPLHTGDWQNIYTFVIQPMLKTPRDVRRLVQSVPMTLRLVGDEVALEDVLGLEAVRVMKPEMFRAMVASTEGLGATSGSLTAGFLSGADAANGPIGLMVEADPDFAEAVCRWLFPAARRYFENMNFGPEWLATWRRDRRVANPDVLRFYLERRLPENVVPAQLVDDILDNLGNQDALIALLGSLSGERLLDAIVRVTDAVRDVPFDSGADVSTDPAFVSLPIFLDLLPKIPVDDRIGLEIGPTMTTARLVLRLIDRVTDESARIAVVNHVVESTSILSARLIVLWVVGHRPNIGAKLLSAGVVAGLEQKLRDTLIEGGSPAILGDPNPTELVELMVDTENGRHALESIADDEAVFLALLMDARSEVRGRAMGSVAVDRSAILQWDNLKKILTEEGLLRRVASVVQHAADNPGAFDDVQLAAIELAGRYAGGWRPENIVQKMLAAQQQVEQPGEQAAAEDAVSDSGPPDDTPPSDELPPG